MFQEFLFVAFPATLHPPVPTAPVFCDQNWNSQVLHPLQYSTPCFKNWQTELTADTPAFWIYAGQNWDVHVHHNKQQHLRFDYKKIDEASENELCALFEGLNLAEAVEEFCELEFPIGVHHWPGGPLPALLEAMKITTPFQGWQARFEQADRGFFFAEEEAQDWFSAVLAETHTCELAPADSPLELPPESLLDLYRLAWFADMHSDLVLELSAPSSLPQFPAEAAADFATRPRPQGSPALATETAFEAWQVAPNPNGSAGQVSKLLQDLIYLMGPHWQAGSVWQLHAAPKRDPEWNEYSEVRLRFGGEVIKKQGQTLLKLSHWLPGLSSKKLRKALTLSTWSREGGRLSLSPNEAETLIKAGIKAYEFERKEIKQGQEHDQTWVEVPDDFKRSLFAARVFLHRHAQDFQMQAALKYQQDVNEPWEELGEAFSQLFMRPNTGKVLYAGESGEFIEAETSDRNPAQAQSFELLSQELGELGFTPLGSFIWKTGGDVRNTVFGHSSAQAYVMIMESLMGDQFTEFFSSWEGGRSRTSSSNPNAHDTPAKRIEQRPYPDLSLAEIWTQHQQVLTEATDKLEPCPPDLDAFLKRLDRFLCHQLY